MGDFTFVLKDKGTMNQGWWLKISSLDELDEYYRKCESTQVKRTFGDYMACREFGHHCDGEPLRPHMKYSSTLAMGLHAVNNNISPVRSLMEIEGRKYSAQAECLLKGQNVYVNCNGGWHPGKNDYSDWYRRKEIVFPDFKKSEIRVEKFPLGQHFYAYVGDLQVRDGDILKWNTYEEAYAQALKIVGKDM